MRLPLRAALPALVFLLGACSGKGAGTSDAIAPIDLPTVQATAAATPTSASPDPQVQRATGPAEHDGKRTLAHIEKLAKGIGPRVSGTKGEADAAAYIAAEFRSGGYTVEVMDFTYDGDRFRAGTVTVSGKAFEALTLTGSTGGSVSAPSAFLGLADAEGIGGRSLKGKVAVADRGTLRFGEKYEAIRDAGAIALVILNNQAGPFSGDLRTTATFPVVGISGEDAPAVREAARLGADIKVEAPEGELSKAVNVIARPAKDAQCDVLVGGHHDSVPGTGGANDNASGTAMVVELARAFAADGLDRGLCFATFGAEESGLYGSTALVERFKSEGRLPGLMLNLDVAGIGTQVTVIGDAAYRQKALDIADELDIPAFAGFLPANTGSDHQSFQQAGVPVLYLESGDFGTLHTPQDVVEDIQLDELERVGDLAYATILRLLPDIARAQGRT